MRSIGCSLSSFDGLTVMYSDPGRAPSKMSVMRKSLFDVFAATIGSW